MLNYGVFDKFLRENGYVDFTFFNNQGINTSPISLQECPEQIGDRYKVYFIHNRNEYYLDIRGLECFRHSHRHYGYMNTTDNYVNLNKEWVDYLKANHYDIYKRLKIEKNTDKIGLISKSIAELERQEMSLKKLREQCCAERVVLEEELREFGTIGIGD